ncbi:MAG TPA: DUF1080 domain-containing protein, partial [Planctomycetota bacterium]|nr:DUF1080 domain-containing protein [Planctomycetota bacterium]
TTGGRYDGPARWTVEDGCIVGRTTEKGEGGLLYTERFFHSFELTLEVKMDHPFDSGVFLRMLPPDTGLKGVQVTLDHRPGGEIGAVYADGFLQHNEHGAKHYRKDEWNHVRVHCVGRDFRLQAWVNGEPVTDYRLPPGTKGFAESGRIGLQVHPAEPGPNVVRFRAIAIRELPVFDPDEFRVDDAGRLTPVGEGWQDLLAGGDALPAFAPRAEDSGFAVRDGVLALLVDGTADELRTVEDFADFELRLDFKLAPLANSGIFLRADRARTDSAFSGCEVQILDDHGWEAATRTVLKPWQKTGSLYGAVAPRVQGTLAPNGVWNTLEIRYQGTRLRTRLNGFTLYDVDTAELRPELGPPFSARAKRGFLGIQRHAPGGAVEGAAFAWIRNAFVRRL